ncbi:MAG: magnesium transporter [Candidatus Diapherotrites archaeon]|nr:magnesium transporter [Candidatus Diapherotrites archaeon]MDZ4256966.1 magnesium transporter [archaeon]
MNHATLSILRQSGTVLLILLFFSLMAGEAIESSVLLFQAFPVLLIILPAFINACGSISDNVSNHVTTALGLGGWKSSRVTRVWFTSGVGGLLTTFLLFGVLVGVLHTLSPFVGWRSPSLPAFMLVVILPGILTVLIGSLAALAIAYAATKYGWDPDNVETPILNTLSDWVGVYLFIWTSGLLLQG